MNDKTSKLGSAAALGTLGFSLAAAFMSFFGGSQSMALAAGVFFLGFGIFGSALLILLSHEVKVVDDEHRQKLADVSKVDITPDIDRDMTKDAIKQIAEMDFNEQQKQKARSQQKPKKSEPSPSNVLHVSNLTVDVSEDDLKNLFSQISEPESVRIVMDKYRGLSKGYGFVDMGDNETAEKAKQQLTGSELDGREIDINYARSSRPKSRSRR